MVNEAPPEWARWVAVVLALAGVWQICRWWWKFCDWLQVKVADWIFNRLNDWLP